MRVWRGGLLVVLATSLFVLPSSATTVAPTWHAAKTATLPSGATSVALGFLPALSCTSPGNCSAGGAFTDALGHTQGLLLDEVGGAWRGPTQLRVPSNAAVDPHASVAAISCSSPGNCGGAGSYSDALRNIESFVVNEVNGVWSTARQVTLPPNALGASQNSTVRSLSCTSTGNCSAIGIYLQQFSPVGRRSGFVVSELRGHWGSAVEISLPPDGNANPLTMLSQVSCNSPGNCVAVGSYIDVNNVTHGLMITQIHGSWRAGAALILPGDASAYPSANLSEISCVSFGNCTALGTYTTRNGAIEANVVTQRGGLWSRAIEIPMPRGAALNPHAFLYGFASIACPSNGSCSAGGQFLDEAGLYQGFFVNEVRGTWRPSTVLPLPRGAVAAGKNGGVVAISCRTAGNCSAGAAFLDQANNYQALVINEVDGTWRASEKLTLPSGATSVGVNGGVYGLICSSVTSCTATGTYLSSSGLYQGFSAATS